MYFSRVPTKARPSLVIAAIALIFVSALASRPAFAVDEAEQMIRKGLELRKRGDDLGALPLFEQAYRTSHTARAAAQLGFCEQALGRWTAVELHLAEVLKTPDDPWVKKNRAAIDESLAAAKSKVAVIEILGEPSGGEVRVNASVVGRLPLPKPLRVEAGEIDVDLRAEGYRRTTKSLRVEGGQYQKVVMRAEPEPIATPAPKVPTISVESVPPRVAPAPQATPAASASVTTGPGDGSSDWLGTAKWVSWGLGAAALGVGVYGALRNKSLVGEFDEGCAIDPSTERVLHDARPKHQRLQRAQDRLRVRGNDQRRRARGSGNLFSGRRNPLRGPTDPLGRSYSMALCTGPGAAEPARVRLLASLLTEGAIHHAQVAPDWLLGGVVGRGTAPGLR